MGQSSGQQNRSEAQEEYECDVVSRYCCCR